MPQGDLQLADAGAVLIVAISAPPSVEVVEQVEAGFATLLERHPDGGFLLVVRELPEGRAIRRPDPEVRARVVALVRRAGGRLRGLAYVLPPGGLTRTLARAVIDRMLRLAPSPARLFADPRDAVAWLAAQRGPELDPGELLAALRSARARLAA